MATFADLFKTCYLTGGSGVEFAAVRLHYRGADRICRAFGATALTVGSDIYFRDGAFAPHTPAGLQILAHEVAHVVQQHRGPVAARPVAARPAAARPVAACPVAGGLAVAPAGSAEEHEAEAAADALLSGRRFTFARAAELSAAPGTRVIQRYMAWEHCLLGDLDPARVNPEHLEAQCTLLERLGRDPRNVDEERLRAEHPGLETLRLPGSGLVVTLGELNVLPDYLAHPAEIETAPEAFLLPLIQSIRSLNITELRRAAGSGFRPGPRPRLQGSLRYPRLRGLAEIGEVLEVDALGRRCGFAPWKLYSSAVGRNAGHFAPVSWYRWRSYHLMARELIARSLAAAGDDRERLRTRARIYAGYADHFLQDSYAAGHLVDKTLVMQWYVEWLADARVPCLDRHVLTRMTTSMQPFLHDRDPQSVVEAPTLAARIDASGVIGSSDQERRDAYAAYLAMLGSSVAQLAASLLHGYFNKRSLVVAAGPDGPRFRIHGDRTLLAGGDGTLHAAQATAASRQAIAELLASGETVITCREIFDGFPDHVEQGGRLVTLRQWHDSDLRDLCFGELFSLRRTGAMRILASAIFRRFGVPSPDVQALRSR